MLFFCSIVCLYFTFANTGVDRCKLFRMCHLVSTLQQHYNSAGPSNGQGTICLVSGFFVSDYTVKVITLHINIVLCTLTICI